MQVSSTRARNFFDHNRSPFTPVDLNYAPDKDVDGPQRAVMVNPRVLEYETLVSLAQLKLHETATVTLALKNIAMSFPAADYYGHPRSRRSTELLFRRHALVHRRDGQAVPDRPGDHRRAPGHDRATGPLGGHAVETGLVIASTDPLAADSVGAKLLGFGPRRCGISGRPEPARAGRDRHREDAVPGMSLKEAIERSPRRRRGKARVRARVVVALLDAAADGRHPSPDMSS